MRGRRECGPRWWRGRGRPARRCTYRRRHAPRRARDDRRTRIEGTRGCRRAPAAPRVPSSGRPPPGPKKNKRENQKRGANLTGPGPARAAFSPVHVVRPVQDVAYGPVLLLLVERGRSVGRHRCRRVRTLAQPTRAQIKKRACDLSRSAKFRAPRPDRRARSCRDASVSVNPPRVRLYVKGCGMSEAELGRIPKVSGAHYPAKPGSAHTRRVEHTVTRVQNHPMRALFTCSGKQPLRTVRSVYSRAAHPRAGLRLR